MDIFKNFPVYISKLRNYIYTSFFEYVVKYAADNGNDNAMYNLGCYYDEIEKNSELAIKYYLMAVENGNTAALNNIAHYYYIEKNYELAVKYFMMAIEKGNVVAMYNLSCYYDVIEKNYELAIKYCMMAIDEGYSDAMYNLGWYYHAAKEYELAIMYYMKAIEKGDYNAMNNLGHYYLNIEENYELAVKYYLMAIEKGHTVSMNNLAYYYYYIEKNYELATKYYLMAINAGDIHSDNIHNCILCILRILNIKPLNTELKTSFISGYNKVPDEFDSVIANLQDDDICYIYNKLLGKDCRSQKCICQKCILDYKKANLAILNTCDICMSDAEKLCIPYNMPEVCSHFTCVDCHVKLRELESTCPFCRQ